MVTIVTPKICMVLADGNSCFKRAAQGWDRQSVLQRVTTPARYTSQHNRPRHGQLIRSTVVDYSHHAVCFLEPKSTIRVTQRVARWSRFQSCCSLEHV